MRDGSCRFQADSLALAVGEALATRKRANRMSQTKDPCSRSVSLSAHPMKRAFFVSSLSVITLILASFEPGHAADLAVTRDGRPRAVVVLPASRKPADYSVKTLVTYVKRMSGATLPTIAEAELKGAR